MHSFKIFGIWPQTDRQTDIHAHAHAQCSHASVGLAQARLNYISCCLLPFLLLPFWQISGAFTNSLTRIGLAPLFMPINFMMVMKINKQPPTMYLSHYTNKVSYIGGEGGTGISPPPIPNLESYNYLNSYNGKKSCMKP